MECERGVVGRVWFIQIVSDVYVYSQIWTSVLIYNDRQQLVNTQLNPWNSYLRQFTFRTAKRVVFIFKLFCDFTLKSQKKKLQEVGSNAEVQPQNTFEIVVS